MFAVLQRVPRRLHNSSTDLSRFCRCKLSQLVDIIVHGLQLDSLLTSGWWVQTLGVMRVFSIMAHDVVSYCNYELCD